MMKKVLTVAACVAAAFLGVWLSGVFFDKEAQTGRSPEGVVHRPGPRPVGPSPSSKSGVGPQSKPAAQDQKLAATDAHKKEPLVPKPDPRFDDLFFDGDWVNLPDGEHVIESLNGGETVRLAGKVRTLRINSVNEESLLDASRLEAREIIVSGSINGRSTVKVHAPNGRFELRGSVNGQSELELRVPNGKVLFGTPSTTSGGGGGEVNGESQVIIAAKDVDLGGKITGGTSIKVTLNAGGKLQFRSITGNAHIHYRKTRAEGPVPIVEQGTITGAAEVKQVD